MPRRVIVQLARWLLPAGLFAAITLAVTYPLIRVAGSAFPHDAGDPALNTWLLWWSTQRVPLTEAWWNAPMFYPMPDAMALSELLIGLLPMTAPVQWLTGSPLLAYNTAFLLSFPLSGLAAYALALDLTGRRDAALLAGLVFAFGPYRMNQLSHLQMLAYYWAPLALFALHRYVNASRPIWLALFAGAWLMQALSNGYALFHLSVLIVLWLIWFVREPRKLVPIVAAWAGAALLLVPALLEYRQAHERLHLARDINEIERFSADVSSFVNAPPVLAVWGGRLMSGQFETALFPGVTVALLLVIAGVVVFRHRLLDRQVRSRGRMVLGWIAVACAAIALSTLVFGPWAVGSILTVGESHKPFSLAVLAGIVWLAGTTWWRRAWRERTVAAFYVTATLAMYVLSFGPSPMFLGRQILYEPPYAWLMRLPGFDVLRVPARFAMLALLCQAVVVALAFARLTRHQTSRRPVLAILVGVGLLADGWIRLPLVAAPAFAHASAGRAPVSETSPWKALSSVGAKAVIELPPGEPTVDFPALYRGMSHGQPLVNGFSGFAPPHYLPLVYAIGRAHVEALQELAGPGLLGVAVDRSLPWHANMEKWVSTLSTAKPLAADDRWATFVVSSLPRPQVILGPKLALASIRANRQERDVSRMADGNIESAWGPGTPQDGREEVIVELEAVSTIGSIVLEMGAYSFAFPRELAIDLSPNGGDWQTVWQGETSVLTVRAALADPENVPLTFDLGLATAKFVRLRQVGTDASVPWWIAELAVNGTF